MRFYINQSEKNRISGYTSWAYLSYEVAVGDEIMWKYTKDYSVTSGSDRGWIDNVQLQIPAPTLSASYKFDEGSGATAFESTGYSINGTIYGATRTIGIVEGALSFDGINDYVQISNVPAMKVNAVSIEGWPQFSGTSRYAHLVDKGANDKANFGIYTGEWKNMLRMQVYCTDGTACTANSGLLDTGKWYHFVGTWDGHASKIYINGELIESKECLGKIMNDTQHSITIGKRNCPNPSIMSILREKLTKFAFITMHYIDIDGFKGTGSMEIGPSLNDCDAEYSQGASLVYKIYIKTPGTYWIQLRRFAQDDASNSCYIGTDEGQIGGIYDDGGSFDGWYWTSASQGFYLSEGFHEIVINRRENGYNIDRILLALHSEDLCYNSETGPQESDFISPQVHPFHEPRTVEIGGQLSSEILEYFDIHTRNEYDYTIPANYTWDQVTFTKVDSDENGYEELEFNTYSNVRFSGGIFYTYKKVKWQGVTQLSCS
ncbi:MAG: LamG domain-containing protein [bacterium]